MSFESVRDSYGITGMEAVRSMNELLAKRSLNLTYDSALKKFSIKGSANLDKSQIQEIISKAIYQVWEPCILDERDAKGDFLVQLQPQGCSNRDVVRVFEKTIPRKAWGRDDCAAEVISDIKALGVLFKGKKCIDIGCRSGENSLAMQNAGAEVIGIDPDDSEFDVAIRKGIEKAQLTKATLQQYHEQFPDNKFDIATVFLWNIPFKERQAFATALKEIIHPDGIVIIGYHDEVYDKDPSLKVSALMSTVFGNVEKGVFPNSLNTYILKCSRPINA